MTAPSPSVEDRLRATLAAEADRHRPAPDFEALRGRADRAVVDLRLPPRRNRTRILTAAVVLAVLAVGGAVVVATAGPGSGEADEPIVADTGPSPAPTSTPTAASDPAPATPTGWYLPGEGWEITSVDPVPLQVRPGLVREVLFMTPELNVPQASVEVWRSADPTLAAALVPGGGTPVRRGTGASEREIRVGAVGTSVHVAVARDDLVLHIAGHEMAEAEVLALADTWWESGGRSLPTPTGQDRIGDDSWLDVPAASTDAVVASWGPSDDAPATSVGVSVRDPEGRAAYYELRPATPAHQPTGVGGDDDAAAHGLSPDEVPEPVDSPAGGEAWLRAEGAIVGRLTGAEVMITSGEGGADSRDLLAGLRSVTPETWQEALATAGIPVEGLLAGPTLTGAPTSSSTDEDEAQEEEIVDQVEQALVGLATTDRPTIFDTRFADEVTIGFMGDHDADVVLADVELLDRDGWVLDLGGRWGRDGTVSALDLLADADGRLSGGMLRAPVLTCSGTEPVADPGYRAVALVPHATGCDTWFAVVAHLDAEDRISEVRVVLEDRIGG